MPFLGAAVEVLGSHWLALIRRRGGDVRAARTKLRAALSMPAAMLTAGKDPFSVASQYGTTIDAALLEFAPFVPRRQRSAFDAAVAEYASGRASAEPALLIYLRSQAQRLPLASPPTDLRASINRLLEFTV